MIETEIKKEKRKKIIACQKEKVKINQERDMEERIRKNIYR